LRGGKIGREDGCLVQLTDPTVSRQHGAIALRDGAMAFVAEAGKRVLINGEDATTHPLESGDELVLGATRLVYLTVDGVPSPRLRATSRWRCRRRSCSR